MRKVVIASLSLSLALSLSACGSGKDAATLMTTQVTDGVESSITSDGNDLRVTGILLVGQPDGSAVLVGNMVNNAATDDALLGISVGGVLAKMSATTLPLTQNMPVIFSGDSANASAVAVGVNAQAGKHLPVYLFFGRAGEMKLNALIVEKAGIYAGVGA